MHATKAMTHAACGNPRNGVGVAMGPGLAQGSTGTSEPLWRGPGAVPWADCTVSSSELIGEDSRVIIRLGANQVMG